MGEAKVESAAQANEHEDYRNALISILYQAADDDLVLGHRDSEWLGIAPEIEEDVAFSSIAQDEVGHATFFLGLLEDLGVGEREPLAYERPISKMRNARLVERPNGDWAFSMARHFFYDVFEDIRLQAMTASSYLPLARGAQKIRREEYYHLLHHETWFSRLAIAGGEARERLEKAISQLWPDISSLFGPETGDVVPGLLAMNPAQMLVMWTERVYGVMRNAGLEIPSELALPKNHEGRLEHSSDLAELLDTMREVYNLDVKAAW